MKKIWEISSLKYMAAFLIPAIFVLILNHSLDNDSWYVLAEGRQIVENGIYYTDTLSMHENLNVTVQNYGFAVIFYLIFSVFGAAGIYVGMLILNFLVCYLVYKICKLISDGNVNLSLLIMVVTDMILALGFVVTRAQMVSFVIFLGLIYVLELYIKTDKTKYLWWTPLFSLLQVNLHASLWWTLVFVVVVYIIDSFKKPRLHLQGYRTKPLIIAGLAMLLVGFLNPYGVKMLTFIFTSYGNNGLQDMIIELKKYSPFNGYLEAFVYISIMAVLFLYIFGKKRSIRVRYLLMFFGFLAIGLNTVKGLNQFILVMFFPLALTYKDVKLERIIDAKIGRNALEFWVGLVSLGVFVVVCPIVISQAKNYPSDVLVNALDAIDQNLEYKERSAYNVFVGYGDGGYVEYRGYKSYIDPRGEVFLKKNNGVEDILYEWRDFNDGKIEISDFLEKYNFDFILSRIENDPFYNFEDEKYEMIFKDEEEQIEVFKRTDINISE